MMPSFRVDRGSILKDSSLVPSRQAEISSAPIDTYEDCSGASVMPEAREYSLEEYEVIDECENIEWAAFILGCITVGIVGISAFAPYKPKLFAVAALIAVPLSALVSFSAVTCDLFFNDETIQKIE